MSAGKTAGKARCGGGRSRTRRPQGLKRDPRRIAAAGGKQAPGPLLGFPAVAAADAELLILGSMPGVASLAAGQYYAHPRNAFWPILAEVLGFDPRAPYEQRLGALRAARIALWDVLRSCEREGSLDARIRRDTLVANDFAGFFRDHSRVRRVVFNGAMAEQCFRRHVQAAGVAEGLAFERLPSTSPANASWSRARKLAAWRRALVGADG